MTQNYRDAVTNDTLAPMPSELKSMETGIHQLVQAIFDESVFKQIIEDASTPTIIENPVNEENFAKFRPMWDCINHKYAYRVTALDSSELIRRSIASIDAGLSVTELKYVTTVGQQQDTMNQYALDRGETFESTRSETKTLQRSAIGQIPYDLVGKIAAGTMLTRKTVASILSGIRLDRFYGFKNNPEEFITKAIKLIENVKSDLVVDGVEYHEIDGRFEDEIFEPKKAPLDFKKAFRAKKHIQDFVFTDGLADKSVERRFAEELDAAQEVCVYAKLPRTYQIPTPLGNYSPDWAIMFHKGTVKHTYFLAETKGSLEAEDLRTVEAAKIACARKLFNEMSNSKVRYDAVTNYQSLLDKIKDIP